jgi:hypothetical protein
MDKIEKIVQVSTTASGVESFASAWEDKINI